ncbi:MAG: tetratricopeptide repeat protein [Sedimentisphaerales bacterium]|nr:tetratricopeptide repeat protein [Sedimentisphaerales bacterium]
MAGFAAIFIGGWFLGKDFYLRRKLLAAYVKNKSFRSVSILQPLDSSVYPPDMAAPTFRWQSDSLVGMWLLHFEIPGKPKEYSFLTEQNQWTPSPRQWDRIRSLAGEKQARLLIIGSGRSNKKVISAAGSVAFSFSPDPVGAPIFYREVNLPFNEAVKDPTRIRWRFGSVSDTIQPPVILENLPVCGNCHSFSRDGRILGMDIDYANSKGSYVITKTAKQMTLATTDIITWNDYKKEDGRQTFGLLSQVSPDGNLVASTVKDRSVFVPTEPLAFSQLFFPVKGILAVYNRQTETFAALPGADDPAYVQSNPTWSPDGKYILFARALAHELRAVDQDQILLTAEQVGEFLKEKKEFKFSIYRIPYNEGQGGNPTPLEGASDNGKSNFFPRFSPDGKWIVFCQAENYMLLQPDSALYVIPAEGGQARRLECNTDRMNSWHSFSPNGRWMVFSSKAYSDYTQLFLTHFDAQANTTPPIVLDRFTAADRAANIPEFVNLPADYIARIHENFLDDYSFVRAGDQFYRAGDADDAVTNYYKALELNPNSVRAHVKLGFLLYHVKNQTQQGKEHSQKALELDPDNVFAHYDLGYAFLLEGRADEAITHLSRAVALAPNGINMQYNAIRMHSALARAYGIKGLYGKAIPSLQAVLKLTPENPKIHYDLAVALAATGQMEQAVEQYNAAMSRDPAVDRFPQLHLWLAEADAQKRQFAQAAARAQKAAAIARTLGQTQLAEQILAQVREYQRNP